MDEDDDNMIYLNDDDPDDPDLPEGPLNLEAEAVQEISAVLQNFKDRAKEEQQRFWDAVDSEYWVAVCFQTREQKEEFLRKLNLIHLGDKYLDGMDVATTLGVKLESRIPKIPHARPFDKEYVGMSLDLDDD